MQTEFKKFSFETVVSDKDPEYELYSLKYEAEKKMCKGNGGNFTFNYVKQVAEVLEIIHKQQLLLANSQVEIMARLSSLEQTITVRKYKFQDINHRRRK